MIMNMEVNLPNMATNEEIDEAEQLRLLALKSMAKRSKPRKAKIKNDEMDELDIVLLRAAALKTITAKNNAQNSLVVNRDCEFFQSKEVSKKRSCEESPLKSKKYVRLEKNMNNEQSYSLTNVSSIKSYKESLDNIKKEHIGGLDKLKVEGKPVVNNSDDTKKIVRNGCMQLSNLDSEKVNETMVLQITFSSSESDDSSSECDTNYILKQKNKVRNSIKNNAKQRIVNDLDETETAKLNSSDDNRNNVIKYMQTLAGLIKNCESEIKERNQQMTILLDAYEKYKNHSETLGSLIESMKIVRDELSKCCIVETDH